MKEHDTVDASVADPIENSDVKYDDPGTWPRVISNNLRQEIVQTISYQEFQKIYKELPRDVNGREFQDALLYTKMKDKRTREHFPREWLTWSASKETLYCLPCRIFCDPSNKNLSSLAQDGFSPRNKPWKKCMIFCLLTIIVLNIGNNIWLGNSFCSH